MLIGVPAETDPAETRVAASPETVKKFIALGAEVAVERGAGLKAGVDRRGVSGGRRAARLRRRKRSARISFSRSGGRRNTNSLS